MHTLYLGGTSITKGGGLENEEFRQDIRPLYFEKYNINLPDQSECNYGFHLGNILGCRTVVNNAKSGSGTKRTIRKALDYIHNTSTIKLHDTTFFFEFTPGIRDDVYFKDEKTYGIVNGHYNEEEEFKFSVIKEWFTKEKENKQLEKKYHSTLETYYNNHFNDLEYHIEETNLIKMFISYMENLSKETGCVFLFTIGNGYQSPECHYIDDGNKKPISEHKFCVNRFFNQCDIWTYGYDQKWLISDEVDKEIDNHFGYYGNIKLANKLSFAFYEIIHRHQLLGVSFLPRKYSNPLEINYFSVYDDEPCIDHWPAIPNLLLNRVDNISDADCIIHTKTSFHQSSDFTEYKNDYGDILTNLENQLPFIFAITQESYGIDTRESINTVFDEWGYDKSLIQYWDTNVFNSDLDMCVKPYICTTDKQPSDDEQINSVSCWTWDRQPKTRTYSVGMFCNKFRPDRMMAVDALCSIPYDKNHDIEPFIRIGKESIDTIDYKDPLLKQDYDIEVKNFHNWAPYLGKSIEHDFDYKGYKSMVFAVKEIYLNIVVETSYMPRHQFNYYDSFGISEQLSEKTIIPLLQGCPIFLVVDGKFYKRLEEQGLDFSYIKENFGIDYLNNSRRENLLALEKIGRFTLDWKREDWHNWYVSIFDKVLNNQSVIEEVLFTNNTELKLYKSIKNGKEVQSNIN